MKFLFWMKKIVGEVCTWSTIEPVTHDTKKNRLFPQILVCHKYV